MASKNKEPPDKKRLRSDRSEKLKERKFKCETVVKSGLYKHLQGDDNQRVNMIQAIQQRVESYSQRVHLASLALSGMVKRTFQGVEDVLDVPVDGIPPVTDVTLIRQLLLGVDDPRTHPNAFVQWYYKTVDPRFEAILSALDRHLGDRNIYSFGAIKYATNVKNLFQTTLEARIRQFTKQFSSMGQDRLALLFGITSWAIPTTMYAFYPIKEDVLRTIIYHRKVLGLKEGQSITPEWLKSEKNIPYMVRYFVLLNKFRKASGHPLFNIVPICSIRSHFVTLDSSSLFGLLKELGLFKGKEADFTALRMDHWYSTFKIRKSEGQFHTFTGTIETDGTSLNIHFTRPKSNVDEAKEQKSRFTIDKSNDRIIGVDPGRTNIIYAVEGLPNGEFQTYVLRRKHYYQVAGIFYAREHTEAWSKEILPTLNALSTVSTKGSNWEDHQAFLAVHLRHRMVVWDEMSKRRWARQRLWLYGKKKQAFADFFNTIQNHNPYKKSTPLHDEWRTKRVVVGYGSAKFAPGGKNELSVPTCKAYKECASRFPTRLIDEFRTTKIYHKDGSLLQRVTERGVERKVVRGLLWYRSTSEGNTPSKFVDRDLNAAINILRCFAIESRPVELQRRPNLPCLVVTTGKVIRKQKDKC
jgi:hypothetical protein